MSFPLTPSQFETRRVRVNPVLILSLPRHKSLEAPQGDYKCTASTHSSFDRPTRTLRRRSLRHGPSIALATAGKFRTRCRSNMQRALVGGEDGFVHHFRERRMWEDRGLQIGFRRLQILRDRIALDEFGNLGPDHMRA